MLVGQLFELSGGGGGGGINTCIPKQTGGGRGSIPVFLSKPTSL